MFEISGNGLTATIILVRNHAYFMRKRCKAEYQFKKIIKDCKEIYFEIDMDNMAELMGAMKYLRMNDGVKISDLLTTEEYDSA